MRKPGWILFFVLMFSIGRCTTLPGQIEVGAFRVGLRNDPEEPEKSLQALYKLRNPARTIIIYDASGSMRWPMSEDNPTPRFEPGQQEISKFLREAKSENRFGLLVFGHRLPSGGEGSRERLLSCKDIELVNPLDNVDRSKIIHTITALKLKDHKGDTPLEGAIRASIDLLKNESGEKKIILITDGNDECGGRPDLAAREAARHDIKVYIIAFGIGIDKEGKRNTQKEEEIRQILVDSANAGDGLFFDTQEAEGLYETLLQIDSTNAGDEPSSDAQEAEGSYETLLQAELAIFTYTVRDKSGQEVLTGRVGQVFSLKPGEYEIIFNTDKTFSDRVKIQSGKKTKIFVALSPEGLPEIRQVVE